MTTADNPYDESANISSEIIEAYLQECFTFSSTGAKANKHIYFEMVNNTVSGDIFTIDWRTSNKQELTLTDNQYVDFTEPNEASSLVLVVKQDTTGSRTIDWQEYNSNIIGGCPEPVY